ncbi:hypothetical protein QBC47DRAFT_369456 [Echria macrotheca]|uniref:Uncharacterized protein n=1 Tax=Echria macrotheca TaxID=438768 RepID=A0AAJ0BMW3_9PEZI|nr:hypothetical protein QBC47DRAFT_369456 [Echria macrotheca]
MDSSTPFGQPADQKDKPENQDTGSTEKIPPLTLITPCIFNPIDEDMVRRFSEDPPDRIERLGRILESIDYQQEGVRENLIYMFDREKQRLVLDAVDQESADPRNQGLGVEESEFDQVIQNMEAPPVPGKDYTVKPEDIPPHQLVPPHPAMSARERVAHELLAVVESGTAQLTGYRGHITGVKQKYLDFLEREQRTVEQF